MHDKILILDFGSQVTQLIARRVRDSRVYSEIHPYDVDPSFIEKFVKEQGCKGIILSGGPSSVTEGDTPRAPEIVFNLACQCWASVMACKPWLLSWVAK